MGRAIERIEQEIAAMDQALAAIAQEFRNTYRQYLTALGQAVRQQLILASYHICTHAHPDRFLRLSLSQRQELQQGLRQLAKQAQTQLLEQLETVSFDQPVPASLRMSPPSLTTSQNGLLSKALSDSEDESGSLEEEFSVVEDLSEALEQLDAEAARSDDFESNDFDSSTEAPSSEEQPIEQSIEEQPDQEQSADDLSEADRPSSPKDVARWQELLEERVAEKLQNFSHAANRLLQQAGVLSSRLPEPVLEVASKADLTSETSASPPNLLNLLVETETDESKTAAVTQVMAVRLRLSEIEFGDSTTTVWRSKIRNLSAQLNKLGREYHKKQKAKAIAEAEAAWRSSWYEDEASE
jgi:hypothetical protein